MRWCPLQRIFLVYPGGSEKQSTQTNVQYSPAEAARRTKVMDEAERIFGLNRDKATTAGYPGAKPVGFSPLTQTSQDMLVGSATGAGTDLANRAASATSFGLSDVLYPETNPALQATIDTATRKVGQTYTDPGGVLSQIRSGSGINAGGGFSSRQGIAEGIAARSYLDTIGDVTGKITSEGYTKGLDTFSKTLATSPQTYNLMMQPALSVGAVGNQQEQLAQQKEQFAADSRSWDLNAPWMGLQNYANIVFGGANPSTSSTATGSGVTGTQRAGMALGGATLGAQVGGPWGAAAGGAIGLLMSYMM